MIKGQSLNNQFETDTAQHSNAEGARLKNKGSQDIRDDPSMIQSRILLDLTTDISDFEDTLLMLQQSNTVDDILPSDSSDDQESICESQNGTQIQSQQSVNYFPQRSDQERNDDSTTSDLQPEHVYLITPIGKTNKYKYHLVSCNYAKKKVRKMRPNENFDPCNVCKPDIKDIELLIPQNGTKCHRPTCWFVYTKVEKVTIKNPEQIYKPCKSCIHVKK